MVVVRFVSRGAQNESCTFTREGNRRELHLVLGAAASCAATPAVTEEQATTDAARTTPIRIRYSQ